MLPLKMSRCLAECGPSGRDSSLNLLVMDFVSGAVSLSQVDVAFNVLNLSVVNIILVCRFLSSPLSSTCSSSNPDFHFHQRICCSSCGVLAHMSMSSARRM